ncbi:MAG: 1-acyl-sn-glycerol-3-phosphate acyltransferase [Bacilli bacterium]|nr:1-acyl-sn-glycerol-3-phosphate acyltransferase [Bacilli bacterium]
MNSISLLASLIIDLKKNQKRLNDDKENNYKVCQDVCKRLVQLTNVPLIVDGKENIPKDGSVLITSNHTSFYDIFALVSVIDRYMTFAAAKELMKYPILNKYISSIDCVLIDRSTEDLKYMKEQLQSMEKAIKSGGLILFPEGECSYMNDEIKDFKKGGFMAANKLDVRIVPTYIKCNEMKKVGKWFLPTKEVVISFGKSFTSNEIFDKKVSAKVLSKYTKEKVLELKNRS